MRIATGLAIGSGVAPTIHRLAFEPHVRAPEDELPGRATWYASTCRQCSAGCGIIVRVINGRARKIEGNPAHPLNRGKLCARGQAGLQLLYDPDRLRNAVRQSGGRGSRHFEPISWTTAIEELAGQLSSIADPSRIGVLAGSLPDHLHQMLETFCAELGAPAPVFFDLHNSFEGRRDAAETCERWFGTRLLPSFDLSRAEVVFSFGANFLETWMSPVAQGADYGEMRQGQLGGRGFLVQFEPRLSATAAVADEWIPIRPGTEGLIALGLGRVIVEENLGTAGSHRQHAHLYRNIAVDEISAMAGIPPQELRRLARIFANADQSVAIPGGSLSGHANAAQALDAVMALNVIMRRLGKQGGVFLPFPVPSERFASVSLPSPFADLKALVDRMAAGAVDLLLVLSANPVYELPGWTGFQESLSQVAMVVSNSSTIDETAAAADLILPDHTYLESWGFQVPAPSADRPVVSGLQPVVEPLYDTRSTGDWLLTLAQLIGGSLARALPWQDEVTLLEEVSADLTDLSVGVYETRSNQGMWSRWRQFGGWWSARSIRQEPEPSGIPAIPLMVPDPAPHQADPAFPYFLLPYPSLLLSAGRGANQSWLQETADPMTTARWNTWVEINPQTAAELGLQDNDLVRVSSAGGALQAPVVLNRGLRPDVIAIPLGQGHQDYGRLAAGRGANVIELITGASPGEVPRLNWASTRVQLEPVVGTQKLARLESLEGEGRETIR